MHILDFVEREKSFKNEEIDIQSLKKKHCLVIFSCG